MSVAANRAKAYADALQREEKYEAGNEVVLEMRHLHNNEHLPVKLKRQWIGAILYCQCDFSSGLLVESNPKVADSSCPSCTQSEEVVPVGGV